MEVLKIKSLLDTKLQREDILDYLRGIILNVFDGYPVTVYLFGSWAKAREKRTSDIDIAIWYGENMPNTILTELRSIIDESEMPYKVDLVDLTRSDDKFIKKEGIVWKDYKKGL